MKKKKDTKGTYSLNDLYNIYDKYKLYALVKIINEESELVFYEDNEKRDSNTKERDIKIPM